MAVSPVPTRVVVVLTPRGNRLEIEHEVGDWARVEWCERADVFLDVIAHPNVVAVVLGLEDEHDHSIAAVVVEAVARRPTLPILLYDRLDGGSLDAVLAVLGVGLQMEIVVRPHERLRGTLERMTDVDYRVGVAPLLLQRFAARAPTTLRLFVCAAALGAPARRGLDEIAAWCAVSPRTIERRLHRARWPAAHVVLQSFAALDAVWLMSQYGWSARRVRATRGFPHPSSVTRLLARYAGVRPATLREDGGFASALAHVTRMLSAHEPP